MTAVEWLQDQYDNSPESILIEDDFKQAKEMEKEQIMDAFIFSKDPFGLSIGNSHTIKKAEDYYNKTFKLE
jgi:hypothetical protein